MAALDRMPWELEEVRQRFSADPRSSESRAGLEETGFEHEVAGDGGDAARPSILYLEAVAPRLEPFLLPPDVLDSRRGRRHLLRPTAVL